MSEKSENMRLLERIGVLEAALEECRRRGQALAESENRLKMVLEAVNEGFWEWDIDTGEVYFSPRWYAMLGYEPGELPSGYETWKALLHPDDAQEAERAVVRHAEEGAPYEIEFRMRTKPGGWKWIMARGRVAEVDGGTGRTRRMFGSQMDIDDRKRAQEADRRYREELETKIEGGNMAKIERNEPCPCGSGKKYMKCCMGKEEPEARIVFGKRNYHWSPEEIARFPTDEIIGALKKLGVRFGAEQFAKDTKSFFSACKLAEHWASQGPFGASGYDQDFPWMACIVLWERLAPGLLCWEKIDDSIEHGYAASKRGNPVEACENWLTAWKSLEPRFPVETKTIDDAEEALSNMSCEFRFSLFEWCVDFIDEFEKAASKDPSLNEKRIGFSREFLSLFPESEELMVYLMGKSEAEALFFSGRAEEGEKVFRSLAEKLPRWEWVYVKWSEMYASPGRKELPLDLKKAEKILQAGLERVADGKEELIERLEEIGKLSINSAF